MSTSLPIPVKDLKPQTTALLHEIEAQYGRPIQFKDESTDPYEGGFSTVEDDGKPVISICGSHPLKEDVLVHELFHLKLRLQGFPIKNLRINNALHPPAIMRFYSDIHEVILHTIMFPQIEKLGFDPRASFKLFFRGWLDSGDIDNLPNEWARAIYAMRMMLECDDGQLLALLIGRFEKNGWQGALKKGKLLAGMVNDARAGTPREMIPVAVACANALLDGVAHFGVTEWGTKEKGSMVEATVKIDVTPP